MNKKQSSNSKKTNASTADDTLRRLAFENSYQANIISTVSDGKIIMVNNAACKLLGYSKKGLLAKDRGTIFNLKDSGFQEMLKQRTAEGHSIALVTVTKKSGKLLPCKITSAVFMDDGIEKSITSISNMTELIRKQKNIDLEKEKIVAENIATVQLNQELSDVKKGISIANDILLAQANSDARLAENNAWIKYIAKTSYDVMWDWDIASGQVYVGDSIEEVFGYKVQNNTMKFKDFIGYLLPEDKRKVKAKLLKIIASSSKKWNDAFLFRRKDGSVSSTICRASIVRDEKGKAIRLIGAIQDISRLQELEKKMNEQLITTKEHSDVFQLAAKLSYDGIWDWNLLTNEFFLGEGFQDLFGYAIENGAGNMVDWSKHLHPDDKEAVEKGLQDSIASDATTWEHTYRFIRSNGSIAEVFGRAKIIRNDHGMATRLIGAVHDISKQRVLEEKLAQEIKSKELRIAEATQDAKDSERSDIGKELHDNVNQLLGASKMYLEMAKTGGDNSAMFISRSAEYTHMAIEEIRKLTKGLTTDIINNFGLRTAIDNIVRDMMEVNKIKISCSLAKFEENSVNNKFKLNVYRIVQEQLNNILKHAKAKKIAISLVQNKKSLVLTISDNGVGFNTSKIHKGIGVENIKERASTYNGEANFVSNPGEGCILAVTFPITTLVSN